MKVQHRDRPSRCKGVDCGAAIWFLESDRTGKISPIDEVAHPNGNITINIEAGTFHVLVGRALIDARDDGAELRLHHSVSCPNSDHFIKR